MFRIIPEGLAYKEHVLLKNGQGLLFKPATPKDVPLVESFMSRLSQESLRMRFMASVSQVPRSVVEDLCNGDFVESGCLLAISKEKNHPLVVGLGNYIGMGNGRSAEVAFLIEDSYQGLGISTLLLERLAGLAAANGYIELEAEVLPDNQPMIGVFKSSGFQSHQVWSSDTVHIELPVDRAAALWERAGLRERISVANSLAALLRPKTVAVIGASRNSSAIGNMIFRHILNADFSGTVYPVNPEADSVNGVKAYSSVDEIPGPIDLAVITVPAKKVQEVAENAIHAGAKGLVVMSAGFAEAGPEGIQRQQSLVKLVRAHGVRLIGPSCLGLMNTDPAVRLNASLAPRLAPKGSAGFFSHSAALGLVIIDYAREKGLGFSSFISAGNRADVSGNDLLLYWEEDPKTRMAILYLEAFGNPRRFVRIARRMSYKKPILSVKSARSSAGRKTAEAKSGISSGGIAEVKALFHQSGIIQADTLDELFDVAVVLAHQPLPKGNRVSIIANSAGFCTIFADACEANGLQVAGTGLVNLGAFAAPKDYERAIRAAYEHNDVDSLLVGFACVGDCGSGPVADAIRQGVKAAEQLNREEKPVLLCLMGATGAVSLLKENEGNDKERMFPAFRFPEAAPRALSKVVRYAEFRKQPPGALVWYEDVQADKARRRVQDILRKTPDEKETVQIQGTEAEKILQLFGLNTTDSSSRTKGNVEVRVRPDPFFGPLLELETHKSAPVVRITPLTDRDLEEISKEARIPANRACGQILGRLSQMIEELPWLWKLEAKIFPGPQALLYPGAVITLKPGGALRPDY